MDVDSLEKFIQETLVSMLDTEGHVSRTNIVAEYRRWCATNEEGALSNRALYTGLRSKGWKEVAKDGERHFAGPSGTVKRAA